MLLLTGAAGFIGFHTANQLLDEGREVVGVDNVNDYYDPALKRARLDLLKARPGFKFVQADIADRDALEAALPSSKVENILHLAAQAGVRYSLEAPFAYERSNVAGHLTILEYARRASKLKHLVYASSSSVYGDRDAGPFRETDRCDSPASLYAATKKSCELMSETYARLYGLPQTGLRFFTVYGPWGRPDMAYWSFSQNILNHDPITLYGDGLLSRDFTYIDDVAPTIARIIDQPPPRVDGRAHEIFNLGNSTPTSVLEFVDAIEWALGEKAQRIMAPPQPGDVTVTFADISKAAAAFGYDPKIKIRDGIPRFTDWFKNEGRKFAR
jgi:UDP-glucuronate 4-epimerase